MYHTTELLQRRHFIVSALSLALASYAFAQPPAHILVLGDSLSAEYGLSKGTGWVALLEKKLAIEKPGTQVTNASVSGDTTAGGRARLPALLKLHRPDIVIIELGGNDALRGLPLASTHGNLSAMTQTAQQAGAKVMLLGMQIPPNYGRKYAQDFERVFVTVSSQHNGLLLPFFLQGIADTAQAGSFFQPDQIHPNAKAQPLMLDNVWTLLRRLLP